MKNWILAALLAALSALALAQTPPPAARGSADESAVHTALHGANRGVDAAAFALERTDGSRDGHVFLVMAGIGMDADVMGDTRSELKAVAGPIAYVEAWMRHMSGRRRRSCSGATCSPWGSAQARRWAAS